MKKNILRLLPDCMEFVGFDEIETEGTFSIIPKKLAIYPGTLPMQSNQQPFSLKNGICRDTFMLSQIRYHFGFDPDTHAEIEFQLFPHGGYISVLDRSR